MLCLIPIIIIWCGLLSVLHLNVLALSTSNRPITEDKKEGSSYIDTMSRQHPEI